MQLHVDDGSGSDYYLGYFQQEFMTICIWFITVSRKFSSYWNLCWLNVYYFVLNICVAVCLLKCVLLFEYFHVSGFKKQANFSQLLNFNEKFNLWKISTFLNTSATKF